MNDDIYNKFWEVIGKPRPNGFEETYQKLVRERREAVVKILRADGPDAKARAQAVNDAFSAIVGREAHAEYSANQLDALLVAEKDLVEKTGPGVNRGLATRISQSWKGLFSRITRPSAAKAIGEPQALPLVETARGAPLEPIAFDATHIRLAPEEIPIAVPASPANVAATEQVTSASLRAASAEKLAAAKAAEAQRQIARAERSAEMRATSAAEREAAKAAQAERVATMPARKAAAIEANAERISSAQAVQAEAAASKAARVAAAEKAARASFQAQKGTIGQRVSANTANLTERATMPLIKRFRTKDPYKILGITPHTSQTAAMAAFEAKLAALGDMRVTSPRAQHEWQRLHDAYEAVYEQLFERTKFTPPAIPVAERTSKIGAAFGRAREVTAGIFGKMKGWVKGKPATAIPEANAEAPEVIKLLAGPTAEAAESVAKTPNLPILHPTANGKLPPTASGLASGGETSSIKLITGPVYSSAELNGGRRISYLSNAVEHSPLRGKLLLAGGVVAAAAIGYFGNRKQEKYPMPPMPRPRAANWVEATQQPAISGDIRR